MHGGGKSTLDGSEGDGAARRAFGTIWVLNRGAIPFLLSSFSCLLKRVPLLLAACSCDFLVRKLSYQLQEGLEPRWLVAIASAIVIIEGPATHKLFQKN